ncbi:MAG: C10 family peptidase [Fibromonadaceae bacterium]|jgi:hypothetical protein|nr:C10 family peptidase [Fibromonadaceae bacterium]
MKITKIFSSLLFLPSFVFLLSCSAENSTSSVSVINERELLAIENAGQEELTKEEIRLLVRLQRSSDHIGMEEASQRAKEYAILSRKSNAINSLYNRGDSLLPPFQRNHSKRRTTLSSEELSAANVNIRNISVFLSKDVLKRSDMRVSSSVSIPDTLAYVFDFDNNEGYAIISADARINESVLGFVSEGFFDRQAVSPGKAFYLDMLDVYLVHTITEAERQKDSLLSSIQSKLGIDNLDIEDIGNILNSTRHHNNWNYYYKHSCNPAGTICRESMGPIIPVQWGQRWPFNDSIMTANSCPAVNNINAWNHNPGGRRLAGCGATAAAQVMAYWQHPSINTLTGMNATWAGLNNLKTKHDFHAPTGASFRAPVASAFKTIAAGIGTTYGCDVSISYYYSIMDYLRSFGHNIHSQHVNWSDRVIGSALGENIPKPTFIRGCNAAGGCHFWLIDGWVEEYRPGIPGITLYFMHNWGWDGEGQGEYPVDVINSVGQMTFAYQFGVMMNVMRGP